MGRSTQIIHRILQSREAFERSYKVVSSVCFNSSVCLTEEMSSKSSRVLHFRHEHHRGGSAPITQQ